MIVGLSLPAATLLPAVKDRCAHNIALSDHIEAVFYALLN